ncbi:integrase [Enemella evansiae]|nr:integrase [Enemella evansiae]
MLAVAQPDPSTIAEADLLAYLAGKDWAPETRKAARSVLRSFFAWAAGRGRLVAENPAAELPSVRVPAGVPHPIPTAVLDAALARADDKGRLMLLLGAYAGLRRAEIAAVHPARDIGDGVLRVVGKGGRSRAVPLHPLVAEAIDAELDRRRAGQVGTGFRYAAAATADGYLFPGPGADTHVQPGAVGSALADLLGEHWTAHGLRHRFATRAYAGTRDLRAVQELLGHSQPETTARYTAVPDGALTAAVLAV